MCLRTQGLHTFVCSERRESAGKGEKQLRYIPDKFRKQIQAQVERLSLDRLFLLSSKDRKTLGFRQATCPLRAHMNKKPHLWPDHDRCEGVRNRSRRLVEAEDG